MLASLRAQPPNLFTGSHLRHTWCSCGVSSAAGEGQQTVCLLPQHHSHSLTGILLPAPARALQSSISAAGGRDLRRSCQRSVWLGPLLPSEAAGLAGRSGYACQFRWHSNSTSLPACPAAALRRLTNHAKAGSAGTVLLLVANCIGPHTVEQWHVLLDADFQASEHSQLPCLPFPTGRASVTVCCSASGGPSCRQASPLTQRVPCCR